MAFAMLKHMSNKKTGVFPMLVGAVAGAAAVFFSDKKNREKANRVVAQGKASVKKISQEAKKNPEAFAKKMLGQASATVKKISRQAMTTSNKKTSKKN